MRISDWSSDVCSSDLRTLERVGLERRAQRGGLEQQREPGHGALLARRRGEAAEPGPDRVLHVRGPGHGFGSEQGGDPFRRPAEIGRASGRGRGWQIGYISVGARSFKKKKEILN